jgi:hypothetical protein
MILLILLNSVLFNHIYSHDFTVHGQVQLVVPGWFLRLYNLIGQEEFLLVTLQTIPVLPQEKMLIWVVENISISLSIFYKMTQE